VSHLERHKLLRTMQHRFMHGRSCTTNLLAFFEKVTAALDSVEVVDIIYLDLILFRMRD
jgi:hypothetical protein